MEENAIFYLIRDGIVPPPLFSNKCSTGLHRPLQNISENETICRPFQSGETIPLNITGML
jgi:hypothetical protein